MPEKICEYVPDGRDKCVVVAQYVVTAFDPDDTARMSTCGRHLAGAFQVLKAGRPDGPVIVDWVWSDEKQEPRKLAPDQHTPTSAALLATDAIVALPGMCWPYAISNPILHKLRALVELCARERSLVGKPVRYDLELAQGIVDAAAG